MNGLMSDTPLSLVHVFGRGERLFASKTIATATPTGIARTTYSAWAARTRKLAGAFDVLGLAPDARVGTFAWNTARHLELYYAAPCSGRSRSRPACRRSGTASLPSWMVATSHR